MDIICDQYGILVNGHFAEGQVLVAHPTAPAPNVTVLTSDTYTGPTPLVANLRLIHYPPTFFERLACVWHFAKWIFSNPPLRPSPTYTLSTNPDDPTDAENETPAPPL